MSVYHMVDAMKAKIGSPIRKLVLIKLADNANDEGICWPSYRHIADHCEVDRSTVIRHMKWLEGNKFLTKKWRKDDERGNKSNVYQIDIAGGTAHLAAQNNQGGSTEQPAPSGTVQPRTCNSFESVSESVISSVPPTGGTCVMCGGSGMMSSGDPAVMGTWNCPSCNGTGKTPTYPDQPTSKQDTAEPNSKAGKAPATDKSNTYPDEFEWIWKNKPERSGGNPKKSAYSKCKARIKQGATWRQLADGVVRYRKYQEAKGNIGTEYVMQMVRFFGSDEHYTQSWDIPVSQGSPYQAPGSEHQGPDQAIFATAVDVSEEDRQNSSAKLKEIKGIL